MHHHPTMVHTVADHRRAALLTEARAHAWAIAPAARTRQWQPKRRARLLVDGLTDILSRILQDFEPTPQLLIRKAD